MSKAPQRGDKPERRALRGSQDSALEFYGRSTLDAAHKLAAQAPEAGSAQPEQRERYRVLHEEETDRLRNVLESSAAEPSQVFNLQQYNAVQAAVIAAHARRGAAKEASSIYVTVCTMYLWLLLPGVLLFSIATVIFTSLARLLQSSKSSGAARQPRVPSVDRRKVQEHVDRIQKARKVVCSGMRSG